MQAQMYSIKEFPVEVRSSFNLVDNPYKDSPKGEEARKYLQSLGVIFYRDEDHPDGIIIQPNDGNTTPITERPGFEAYRFMVDLTKKTPFTPDKWVSRDLKAINKYEKRYGDLFMWLKFNDKVIITELNNDAVTLG